MSEYYCEIDDCENKADYECFSVDEEGEPGTVFCCKDHRKDALVILGVDEYYAGLRIKELDSGGSAE
ncbi:MAG: hypothetical protein ABFD54_04400 [Armatimonadota bacterium]